MTSPPYNHARKAGNRGDVWKHVILAGVIDALAAERPVGSRFSYLETHAGGGDYTLVQSGAWRDGVGRLLASKPALARSSYARLVAGITPDGGSYPGSWVIAARRLSDAGLRPRLVLCETDPAAAAQATGVAFLLSDADVTVIRADGFVASAGRNADFLFVDPPYKDGRDWDRAAEAIRDFDAGGSGTEAWMLWYHIPDEDRAAELVQAIGVSGYELLWGPEDACPGDLGCGVMLGGAAAAAIDALDEDLHRVADALGGRRHLRTPRE